MTTTAQLRRQHNIPANSFVHISGNPILDGYRPCGPFDFEPVYRLAPSGPAWTESELLLEGKACFRVQVDRFTVRSFFIAAA